MIGGGGGGRKEKCESTKSENSARRERVSGSGLSLFSRVRVTACSPFHGGRGHRLGDKLDRIVHLSSRVRTYLPDNGGQPNSLTSSSKGGCLNIRIVDID